MGVSHARADQMIPDSGIRWESEMEMAVVSVRVYIKGNGGKYRGDKVDADMSFLNTTCGFCFTSAAIYCLIILFSP